MPASIDIDGLVELPTLLRYRKTTRPHRFTVRSNGAVVDITGWTFTLGVNPEDWPDDDAQQVLSMSGTITNAAAGEWTAAPASEAAADVPQGVYNYGIRYTDNAGASGNLGRGRYVFVNGIPTT